MAVLGPENLSNIAQVLQTHHARLNGVEHNKLVYSGMHLDDLCLLSDLQSKIYYALKSFDELPYICWPSVDEILKLLDRQFNDEDLAKYSKDVLLPVFKEEKSLRTTLATGVLGYFIERGKGSLDCKGSKNLDIELFKRPLSDIHSLTPDTLHQSDKPISVLTDVIVNHLFLGKRSIQIFLLSAKKSVQSAEQPLDEKYLKDLESADGICRTPRFDTMEFNLGPSVIFSGRQISRSLPNSPTAKVVHCNRPTHSAPTTPVKKGEGSQPSIDANDSSILPADFAKLALGTGSTEPLVPSLRKKFEEQGFIDGPSTKEGENTKQKSKSAHRF